MLNTIERELETVLSIEQQHRAHFKRLEKCVLAAGGQVWWNQDKTNFTTDMIGADAIRALRHKELGF
jgi:hypothetical protein